MLALSIIAIVSLLITGTVMFIECKIVEDFPEDNSFRKWWRKHIVGNGPKELW
jgi:hypothetical protein